MALLRPLPRLMTAMIMIRVVRVRTHEAFLHTLPVKVQPRRHANQQCRRFASAFSEQDEQYLEIAVQHARNGLGHTFPNPAVGCVIVQGSQVIGAGFHPKAGLPHAEVFALLQAAGHLEDGLAAAKAVIDGSNQQLVEHVTQLTKQYLTDGGPSELLSGTFVNQDPATAYVTLEPCCHHGQTPPCAASLVMAGVTKVVVGYRDPNPRVNGGGYQVLEDAGIQVVESFGPSRDSCAALVENFVKRITLPREAKDYSNINGAKRRALRALGGRQKTDKTLAVHIWQGPGIAEDGGDAIEHAVKELPMDASWLEQVDTSLWKHELLLLRLNNAVSKKKGAKILGERIAEILDAHIAQVMGHTVLLYRPSIPPVLDLEKLGKKTNDEE